MKKLICLMLVLAFCLSFACTTFAAEADDEFVSSPGTQPGCDHEFVDGYCIHCGMAEKNPQTGDNSNTAVWMIVMLGSVAGLVTLTTVYRRRFANQ